MKDEGKTREQLLSEMVEMRQQIAELKTVTTFLKRTEAAMKESKSNYRAIIEDQLVEINQQINELTAMANKVKESEEALQLSVARYNSLAEDQTGLICRFLPGGTLTFVNEAYCRFFDKKHEEILGRSLMPLIIDEDQEKFEKLIASLHGENPTASAEYRVIANDGETRWHQWTYKAIHSEAGHIIEYQAVGQDITRLKLLEEELQKYRDQPEDQVKERSGEPEAEDEILQAEALEPSHYLEELRKTNQLIIESLESFSDAFFLLDYDMRFKYLNKEAEQIFLRPREELIGKNLWDVFPGLSGSHFFGKYCRTYSEQKTAHFEDYFAALNKWFEINAYPTGEGISFYFRDVTLCKETEQSLLQSEKRMRDIIEYSTNLFYSRSIDHVFTYLSPQTRKFLDCEPEEVLGKWTRFLTDNPVNAKGWARCQRAIETGEPQPVYELELVGKTGRKVWVEVNEAPVVQNGETVAIVGALTDITERKLAEEALNKSEAKNQALVNIMPDLLIVIDREGKFVDIKAGKDFVLWKPAEEYIGKNIRQVWPAELAREAQRHIDKAILTGDMQAFEYRVSLNGSAHDQEARVVIYNENEVLIIVREITERKQMEEQLKYYSLHDPLTRLYNRTYFEQEMKRLEGGRFNPIGILVCDVDGLKMVNDTLGHESGDILLTATADVLRKCFREGDMVARIGGDEFAVLLPNSDEEAVERARQRILDTIVSHNASTPKLPISISIGYAVSSEESVKMSDLLREADSYMYREKLLSKQSVRSANAKSVIKALDEKDFIFDGHADRMQSLVSIMAKDMDLPENNLSNLQLLARFHDIGKVGIPDRILHKPGPLTNSEFIEIQRHCAIGLHIAETVNDLTRIADWVLKHHEWWNGEGYPLGLKGEEIPIECRILAIADAFEVMTSGRPYRAAMPRDEALAELKRCAGTQFDPHLVSKFIRLIAESQDLALKAGNF